MSTPITIDIQNDLGRVHTVWTSTGSILCEFKVQLNCYGDYQIIVSTHNTSRHLQVKKTKAELRDSGKYGACQ